MIRIVHAELVLAGALLLAAPARAHQETVAYSRMVLRESGDVEYSLKMPVEDLAEPLGRSGHAPLNGPEVRRAEERLFRHFAPLVGISTAGSPCPAERAGIDVPEDERLYGELRFVFHCPPGQPVTLDYRVFFDVDPSHMGMLEVESPGGKSRAELIVERPRWKIDPTAEGPPQVIPEDPAAPSADRRRALGAPQPASVGSATNARGEYTPDPEPAEADARKASRVETPDRDPRRSSKGTLIVVGVGVVLAGAAAAFLARLRN